MAGGVDGVIFAKECPYNEIAVGWGNNFVRRNNANVDFKDLFAHVVFLRFVRGHSKSLFGFATPAR